MHKTFNYKESIMRSNSYPNDNNDGNDLLISLLLHLFVDLSPCILFVLFGSLRVLHLPEKVLILASLHHNDDRVEKDCDCCHHGAEIPAAPSEHFY
jgi:hypothetical protein